MQIKPINPLVLILRDKRDSVYDRRTKREKPCESVTEAMNIIEGKGIDIIC